MANVIAQARKPTLVIAHNKTLAAQLCNEFREFLPDSAVEYFVSYYDYYQPEAYVPQQDLYIEKDSSINDEIDRLRHAATNALLMRRDTVIVASVSCIFGLGSPDDYLQSVVLLRAGDHIDRDAVLRKLVDIQYQRNDYEPARGKFRVRGDSFEVWPADQDTLVRVELWGDEIEAITRYDPVSGEVVDKPPVRRRLPGDALRHERTGRRAGARRDPARARRALRLVRRARQGPRSPSPAPAHPVRHGDAARDGLLQRHRELLAHPARQAARGHAQLPARLLPRATSSCFIDESHMTVPQIHGMYEGDRSRKQTLVDYGFRLPSALDNRPLRFDEFIAKVPQIVFVSATPGPFELRESVNIAEQIIRPTGLIDPAVEVRATAGQIDDLMNEARRRIERDERVLVTTLTKRMAEDLTDYLVENGFRVRYLHSEIDTLERLADRARAAPRRVRHPGRHQPAARGPRHARGHAGRHPRRRQRGLPARPDEPHPDDRPGGAQRQRHGDHVRRPRDRRHARRHRRDQPPPQPADGLQ